MKTQDNRADRLAQGLRRAGRLLALFWAGYLTLYLILEWLVCRRAGSVSGEMILGHHLAAVGLGVLWASVITLWQRERISSICLLGEGVCLAAYVGLLFREHLAAGEISLAAVSRTAGLAALLPILAGGMLLAANRRGAAFRQRA